MPNKNGNPSEAEEQTLLFSWAMYVPELKWMYAVPNGGKRNPIEAAGLKRQGVKSGVPDIFLPLPLGIYHGLYIEMKVKGNTTTENQKAYLEYLQSVSYKTAVCYGFEEAQRVIKDYLLMGQA